MARSVWKGPFVDGYLLKKARSRARSGAQRGDQDLVAPLDDPAAVRRPDLRRLQRPEAHPGARHRGHGRPQVRRVRADPHLLRPRRRQEGEEEVSHGQAEAPPARSRDNEAKAVARMLRVSPQKLNLVAAADPRQEGRRRRSPTSTFSRKRIAGDVQARCLEIGDRQRREQPRPRRRRPGRRRGLRRQGAGDEALPRPCPRPRRPDREAVLAT